MVETPADLNDYPTIVQICDDSFNESKNEWWIQVALEHKDGPGSIYPDKIDWLDWKSVYEECAECVEEQQDEVNWLIEYMKDNCGDIKHAVAKMVAKHAKVSMEEIFDGAKFPKQLKPKPSTPVKGKRKKTQQQTKSPVTQRTSVEEIGKQCSADHDDINCYRGILDPHYFQAGLKYSEATCRACNLPFATDNNKDNPDFKELFEGDEGALPSLPSSRLKNTVYVCQKMDIDKSDCGEFFCGPCAKLKLLANDERPRKRGRMKR